MEDEEKPRIASSSREKCVTRFKELWTIDEMRNTIIPEMSPNILKIYSLGNVKISNHDKLAEILFDCVGQRFLRNIENNVGKRKSFLKHILNAAISKNIINVNHLLQRAKEINKSSASRLVTIDDLIELSAQPNWIKQLSIELGFPTTVAEKEEDPEEFEPHEAIVPMLDLNPLYDYQHSTGIEIRKMLEGKTDDKRILISVPTGAGKTRMIVETLIEWLNDGKPSVNPQQRNSKFIVWIAQSQELCEQAVSAFKTTFQARGKRGTVLHIHRFWGSSGKKEIPVSIKQLDEEFSERTVIVTTNVSLSKVALDSPHTMERLADLTSCIIIDEAHHSITDSYNAIIETMGFNIRLRTQELSTKGILLIGLTATPFRGSGTCGTCSGAKKCLRCHGSGKSSFRHNTVISQYAQCSTCQGNGQCYTCAGTGKNQESQTLERRYGRIYYPTIPYYENETNFKPHALIDCQTFAIADDNVRIIGERSYDRDGFIEEKDFKWKITKLKKFIDIYSKNSSHETVEWTYEKSKNINFVFPDEGEYKITLQVVDNEGESSETSAFIKVLPKSSETIDETNQQKILYKKLIQRKVLCEVYHWILQSKSINLTSDDMIYLKKYREFKPETIREIGNDPNRNKLILDTVFKIKSQYGRKKILFFGCSIEHSRDIANALKILHEIDARYVDSKMGIDQRVDAIEQFRNGDVEVLCNYDVLTTGFDAPNIDCVFVGRPIKSTLLYTQMIGRGLRGKKSGGTDDVLLVDMDDNFQLFGGINHDKELTELGWKVYAEYWKKWVPQELSAEKPKEQLYQIICSNCGNAAYGIEEITKIFGPIEDVNLLIESLEKNDSEHIPKKCKNCIAKEIEQIIDSKEQQDIQLPLSQTHENLSVKSCPRCGITATSFEQVDEIFGHRSMDGQLRPQSHCRKCRSEQLKSSHLECPFVSFLENQNNIQGNYQMVLGKYVLFAQDNSDPNYVANINDAIAFLLHYNPDKTRSQITADHSVFGVYTKNGLIKSIDPDNGTIVFEKVLEPKKFLELCEKKIIEYKEKKSQNELTVSKSITIQSAYMLDRHYQKLKDLAFGHVPTYRQFNESTSVGIKKLMLDLYGSYDEYLKAKGESIANDLNLQDQLYEQFFDLYSQEKGQITKEMLDEYGDYRVKDYEECFGSYNKFESIVTELISRTKNIDSSITVDDLFQDYEKIKQNLGHSPHFEELRKSSYLGMEYYLQTFGTYGRFLKIVNLDPQDRYFINQVSSVFNNLKKLLRVTPNLRQMKEYSEYGNKLGEKYNEQTYSEFIKSFGNSRPYDDNDTQTKERVRQELISEFQSNINKFGKEKTLQIFYDTNDIVYKEWFGSKENLIDLLSNSDPTIFLIYNALKHQKQKLSSEHVRKSLFSRLRPKRFFKEANCPICNSKLEEFGGGYSCTNRNCGHYSFNQ